MPTALDTYGLNTASEATGAVLGLALGGLNDQRQVNQQKRLTDIQVNAQKQLTDYNFIRQKNMWDYTNYENQIQHMKDAGLNPGLIYGMGGSGGATTNVSTGSVSGGTAQQNPGESQSFAGMGLTNAMNLQLMEQQKELLEAQTEKTKAEAEKTAGVDTEAVKQNIENQFQGLQNLKQEYEVKKLDITMKNIENFEKQASQADRLQYIKTQSQIALAQLHSLKNDNKISDETLNANITKVKQEAIQAGLKNILTQKQIHKTDAEINEISQSIMQNWDKIAQGNRHLLTEQMKMQDSDGGIEKAINALIHIF